ncbi:potassium channel family protein [Planococcus rifietoensis]
MFFRMLKLWGILSRFLKPMDTILKTNSLEKLLIFTVILIFLVPISMIVIEPQIVNYTDAVWWAIVTITTVGYGDIYPETGVWRLLAVILMSVGIGIIGTFTSAISAYFASRRRALEEDHVLDIVNSIKKNEKLTAEDHQLIQRYLKKKWNDMPVNAYITMQKESPACGIPQAGDSFLFVLASYLFLYCPLIYDSISPKLS